MSRAYKSKTQTPSDKTDARTKSPNARDPRARHYDGARLWNELKNSDPNKKYLWVNKSASDQGVGYYEGLGYELVLQAADGSHAKPARGRTISEGSAVEMRGHVLMCIDRATHDDMYQHGWDGQGGQTEFDDIENRILGQGLSKELAQSSRSYMRLRNETSAHYEYE